MIVLREGPVVGLFLFRSLSYRLVSGVVWSGLMWCGVVWCGVVWCGVVWCMLGCSLSSIILFNFDVCKT